jgi:hypothetical protein
MAPEPGKEKKIVPPNTPEYIPEENIFAYNMDDSTTPGGIKVRWKIRIETGHKARQWNARQNQAIRELLQWAHHQQQPSQRSQQSPGR